MRLNAATWAGRTALAAAAAITVAIAAIAVLSAAPASAQSDDETTGRIVARLLEDGRVEFGWQPTGGARVLPAKRYFPASIDHQRWLRSSPVEVDGAEIGRINARQAEDGRIEFAFTPTDGERITPQARYFPADARVGRWLRSTEIAIGTPEDAAPRYIAVSAGTNHTCAIRARDGAVQCWGWNEDGQTDAPEGSYTAVSAGWLHTCAVRESGEIACWGISEGEWYRRQTDAPDGSYTAVSAGESYTCAIRASNGEIKCWGWSETEALTGRVYETGNTDAPAGSFTAASAGNFHTCAIRESGEIKCWGDNTYGQTNAPTGTFRAFSAGGWHSCGLRTTGEIECWGTGRAGASGFLHAGQSSVPAGSFTAVSAGYKHTCAIRASDGAIECWGYNQYGQTTPPPN